MIFVVLPEVEILDLAGPLQAFSEVKGRYRIRVCSNRDRVHSHQGIVLADLDRLPDLAGSSQLAARRGEIARSLPEGEASLRSAIREPRSDSPIVIVPGMPYAATQKVDRAITRWLADAARAGAHIASVCTGAFVVGEAGLLDGRRCTTHWSRTAELARRFRLAKVLEDRLYVSDGELTTSAGIASGIDMALAFIEQADGPIVAAEVAREMVVYLRRDGAQKQSSVYLDYRTHIHPGVHRVQDFIVQNPRSRATLDELADLAGMSARSLTRTFRAATGISVHQFSTRVRAELARTLMHDPGLTKEAVAQRAGFSARQLRRISTRMSSRA